MTSMLSYKRPCLIAHRGGSLEAPENTLAAIQHGVRAGSMFQEVDVVLSRDGVPVVFHDDTLERTTRHSGNVIDYTFKELVAMHAGAPTWSQAQRERLSELGVLTCPNFGDRFARECIPSFESVLRVPYAQLMVELKKDARVQDVVHQTLKALDATDMHSKVVVGSFETDLIAETAKRAPLLRRIGIIEGLQYLDAMLALNVHIIACDTASVPQVRKALPTGVQLWTWTVYTTQMADTALRDGADGLITDIPHALSRHMLAAP